jgi:hypothetical protein
MVEGIGRHIAGFAQLYLGLFLCSLPLSALEF